MTDPALDALIERLEKCHETMTPGEWLALQSNCITEFRSDECIVIDKGMTDGNRKGIATIRNSLPRILAALTQARAGREEVERLNGKCDGRAASFLQLLEERAKELQPDYPYQKHDAFEWLWALTSALEGTNLANDDLHKELAALRTAAAKEGT